MTREEALEVVRKNLPHLGIGATEMTDALETLIPELESEDERIRKWLIEAVHLIGVDKDICADQETMDKAIAWLEKQKKPENTSASTMVPSCWAEEPSLQKEQKPVEPSDDELQRHQDELYDFKVFAAKQAKEHHISFVHDFEWNNFCGEILSYFNEQKPAWSEEETKDLVHILKVLDDCYIYGTHDLSKTDYDNLTSTLKSLRPSWKPSEEQMSALLAVLNDTDNIGAESCQLALTELYEQLKKL